MLHITRAAALAAVAGCAAVSAASVPVNLLFQEGDAVDGSTISSVNAAFTSGGGTVGSLGILEDGRRFIWINNGVAFTSDMGIDTISGGESTIGVADDGSWDASFSLPPRAGTGSGSDDSWYHSSNQTIARELDPYPFIPNQVVGFASRPTMDDEGTAYVVGGYREDDGSNSGSDGRAFWRSTDPASGTYDVIYESFEVIDGFTVGNGGVDFTYDVSGNGDWLVTEIVFNDTPTTQDDNMVYLIDLNNPANKTRLGRENDPTGNGDNFDNWDGVKVNNNGDVLIHGDTNGASAADEFITYNGNFVYNEGDVVGGLGLEAVDAADIDDAGRLVAVFDVGTSSSDEVLVFGSDAGDNSTWETILRVGDDLDFDGNGSIDGVLEDFNISGFSNPFEIGNGNVVWLEIDYLPTGGGASLEAIIGVTIPAPGALAVLGLGGLAAVRRRR